MDPHGARVVRINAFLARAGLGSRRAVENLVIRGLVTLNGNKVRSLAQRVDPERDIILCKGRPVRARAFEYIMFHKPTGCACTRHDPHASQTIYDFLPPQWQHLNYAGRLDVDSEGLLLLSNHGAWIDNITHPRHGIVKTYEVEVEGSPQAESLAMARRGVRDKDDILKLVSARVLVSRNRSARLRVQLKEGKNREIRRIFKTLGHRVTWLKRVTIGRVHLGSLKKGMYRPLTRAEIASLSTEN